MRVVERLGSLQFDPLDVTGRNHDLVLAARIADYQRGWTDALLYEDRRLFEAYNKGLSLLPTAELPWYRVTWDLNAAEHGPATSAELTKNSRLRSTAAVRRPRLKLRKFLRIGKRK